MSTKYILYFSDDDEVLKAFILKHPDTHKGLLKEFMRKDVEYDLPQCFGQRNNEAINQNIVKPKVDF